MPEGPSIVILKEQLAFFKGKKVTDAGGYTPMPTGWLKNKKLLAIKSWGKHLLLQFSRASIKIHLRLFGSVLVNEEKKVNASLYLRFGQYFINFYVVRCERLDGNLADIYDWRTDPLSNEWAPQYVTSLARQFPETLIGDLMMDQKVFTGTGNIIRNEVLFLAKIHPLSVVGGISLKELANLVKWVKKYSQQFLKEKKAGTLGDNWLAYEQEICSRDGMPFEKKLVGKTKRKAYFCNHCQTKYLKK